MAAHGWPAQKARRGAPSGRWPRGHVGARVGRHVLRSREEIRRQLIGEAAPLFKRVLPLLLIRVGLCSHTVCLFCKTRGGARSVRFRLNGGDRVDPSPRDHDQSTCVMLTLSDGDRSVNHSPRGVLRSARFSSRFDRGIKLHRTDVILPRWGASRGHIWTVHSLFEDWTVDRASRRTTIDVRSWLDRHTIVARFVRDRGAFKAKLERKHRGIKGASVFSLIDVRSGHDRGLSRAIAAEIVARKKRKSCQKLRPIHGQHDRCDVTPRNRSHEDIKPPPRSPLPPTNSSQFLL